MSFILRKLLFQWEFSIVYTRDGLPAPPVNQLTIIPLSTETARVYGERQMSVFEATNIRGPLFNICCVDEFRKAAI